MSSEGIDPDLFSTVCHERDVAQRDLRIAVAALKELSTFRSEDAATMRGIAFTALVDLDIETGH